MGNKNFWLGLFALCMPISAMALEVIVPAYFYPKTKLWQKLNQTKVTAILNPGSGPGIKPNSQYVNAAKEFKNSGGNLIGYISSSYGWRPLDEVFSEIERYQQWYQVDGFFIDEMNNTPEKISYYEELYKGIKKINPKLKVVANPGAHVPEAYIHVADQIIVFENNVSELHKYKPQSWQKKYSISRFGQLVYGSNEDDMKKIVQQAKKNYIGLIYVTDDTLPNPWDSLPAYWNKELEEVNSK